MPELSSDEAIAPTRGGDWDDKGRHRALHLHTWNADDDYLSACFESLGSATYQSSNVLRHNPTTQEEAEARFIRALALFDMIDLWGVAVYRDDLESFRIDPIIYDADDGLDFIIREINEIISDRSEERRVGKECAARRWWCREKRR